MARGLQRFPANWALTPISLSLSRRNRDCLLWVISGLARVRSIRPLSANNELSTETKRRNLSCGLSLGCGARSWPEPNGLPIKSSNRHGLTECSGPPHQLDGDWLGVTRETVSLPEADCVSKGVCGLKGG